MEGMVSSEAAPSQLRTGGGNPFTGVSLGLGLPKHGTRTRATLAPRTKTTGTEKGTTPTTDGEGERKRGGSKRSQPEQHRH